MPTGLLTFDEALAALDGLLAELPPPAQSAGRDVVEALRSAGQRARLEADRLSTAQAEALVNSALLVSELEVAREELKRVAYEAEAANRAKSAFLANMSHELRTPLNAIIGYAELTIEQAGDECLGWVQEDLARIRDSGRHLLALVNNVLDISKIEAGRVELEITEFPVSDLIRVLARDFDMLATAKGLHFACDADHALGLVVSDFTRLRQVLNNVLANACKFTSEGSVTLTVAARADRLWFTVRDSGIGMTAEQLSRLFMRFYQADSSTTRLYGGSGLGMHLSRDLVRLLGGTIEVTSEPGKGTTVVIAVPRRGPLVNAGTEPVADDEQ